MRTFLILLIALFPAFSEAQGIFSRNKKPEPAAPRVAATAATSTAALQNGDVIQLRLSGPPEEYTREFAIELSVDDGTVTVPMIGRVKAAGLTPAQLSAAIEKQLIEQKIFSVANININTMQQQRFVIVGGAVRGPGRQIWSQTLSLTGAISSAGGPTEWAEDTVRLTRNNQLSKHSRKAIKANPELDPKLLPNDMIEVEGEF
jgi:protein involved in polysaccharide export with SLBB domain